MQLSPEHAYYNLRSLINIFISFCFILDGGKNTSVNSIQTANVNTYNVTQSNNNMNRETKDDIPSIVLPETDNKGVEEKDGEKKEGEKTNGEVKNGEKEGEKVEVEKRMNGNGGKVEEDGEKEEDMSVLEKLVSLFLLITYLLFNYFYLI